MAELRVIMWLDKKGEWRFSAKEPYTGDVDWNFIPIEVEINAVKQNA